MQRLVASKPAQGAVTAAAAGLPPGCRRVASFHSASGHWLQGRRNASSARLPLSMRIGARRQTPSVTARALTSTSRSSRQLPQNEEPSTKKNESDQNKQDPSSQDHAPAAGSASFFNRLSTRLKNTPTNWSPLPLGIGVAFLAGLSVYKSYSDSGHRGDSIDVDADAQVRVKGPWQVHVIGALPLKTLSRIYGALNEYTLPVWFRVPGYKLYGYIFGVNFDEVENDLQSYTSLSDFFMRRLKPGSREPEEAPFLSPADGRVVNFGTIENRRVEQVKGVTYSLDALLGGAGPSGQTTPSRRDKGEALDEQEFADINGIEYSLDQLLGDEASPRQVKQQQKIEALIGRSAARKQQKQQQQQSSPSKAPSDQQSPQEDASREETRSHTFEHTDVAADVGISKSATDQHGPKPGNSLFFAVVYLAPGDYHRFHSPVSWVVEKRRHFPGELFSVSPWMSKKLVDLFVLNERVALMGRWRHGFFSMVPVGATNVGRIVINFDKDLETNSRTRTTTPGKYAEATYLGASKLLRGQPLRAFDEMGGFMLGSTIVMIFEAPSNFAFKVSKGDKVRVGQTLGDLEAS